MYEHKQEPIQYTLLATTVLTDVSIQYVVQSFILASTLLFSLGINNHFLFILFRYGTKNALHGTEELGKQSTCSPGFLKRTTDRLREKMSPVHLQAIRRCSFCHFFYMPKLPHNMSTVKSLLSIYRDAGTTFVFTNKNGNG